MCKDTFTGHQEGACEIVCLLFSLHSLEIATLTMQNKMT